MDRRLATEASWRAGWDPDDKTLDYNGAAVFYHRKHPCYLKWQESQKTQPDKLKSVLLVGPEYEDPYHKRPIQKNPYYTAARSARARNDTSEDEAAEYVALPSMVFLIADDDRYKEHYQIAFETIQPENDPRGKVSVESAIALIKYVGGAISKDDESELNALFGKDGMDISEVHARIKKDDPEKLAEAIANICGDGNDVNKFSLKALLTLFGSNPEEMTTEEFDKLTSYLLKFGNDPKVVASRFVECGVPDYLSDKTGIPFGEEQMVALLEAPNN